MIFTLIFFRFNFFFSKTINSVWRHHWLDNSSLIHTKMSFEWAITLFFSCFAYFHLETNILLITNIKRLFIYVFIYFPLYRIGVIYLYLKKKEKSNIILHLFISRRKRMMCFNWCIPSCGCLVNMVVFQDALLAC